MSSAELASHSSKSEDKNDVTTTTTNTSTNNGHDNTEQSKSGTVSSGDQRHSSQHSRPPSASTNPSRGITFNIPSSGSNYGRPPPSNGSQFISSKYPHFNHSGPPSSYNKENRYSQYHSHDKSHYNSHNYDYNNNPSNRPYNSHHQSHHYNQNHHHSSGTSSSYNKVDTRRVWGSRSVDNFEKLDQVGEGTYGKVYKARNKETHEIVALKKVRMDNEKEGFPITAIREIKILKELKNENVVQLKEIVTSRATKENQGQSSIYMVFEYMDHDLTGLMMSDSSFWAPTASHIKCYMRQLLKGLYYCHRNGVLHRDIKGSNLLINNQGQLKLADFGLARPFTEQQGNYTNRVITLWYRPPELLLGAEQYGPAIDMWSAGCILAELLAKRAIFPGKHEVDQLDLIFKLCGSPTEENWPGATKLPWYNMIKFNKNYKRCLKEVFKHWPEDALDLVDKLLTLDPTQRISAADALDSEYFWREPLPCEPHELPAYPSSHELEAKKRRQMNQQEANKRQKGGQGQPSSSSSSHHPPSAAGGGQPPYVPVPGNSLPQPYPPPPSNYTTNNGPKRAYDNISRQPPFTGNNNGGHSYPPPMANHKNIPNPHYPPPYHHNPNYAPKPLPNNNNNNNLPPMSGSSSSSRSSYPPSSHHSSSSSSSSHHHSNNPSSTHRSHHH